MIDRLKRLSGDSRGATAIEYALILAFIVLIMIGALTLLADATIGMWGNVAEEVAES